MVLWWNSKQGWRFLGALHGVVTAIAEKLSDIKMIRSAIPVAVSLSRLVGATVAFVTIPPDSIAWLGLYGVFVVTDVVDGWLARRWMTSSRAGAVIDLVCDAVAFLSYPILVVAISWPFLGAALVVAAMAGYALTRVDCGDVKTRGFPVPAVGIVLTMVTVITSALEAEIASVLATIMITFLSLAVPTTVIQKEVDAILKREDSRV